MSYNYLSDDLADILNHLAPNLKLNRPEASKRILAQLPKRHRKNSVVCLLTGEDTFSQSGFHPDAMALIRKALYEYNAKDRTALGDFAWGPDWATVYVNTPDGKKGYLSNWKIIDRSLEALGLRRWRQYVQEDSAVVWMDGKPEGRWPKEVEGVTCTAEQGRALQALINEFKQEIQRAYDTGLRNGSSWLQGMALGQMSIDEINRFETERTRAGENIK